MEQLSQEGGEAEVRGLLGVDSELIEQALKGEMGAVCVNIPTLERTLELLNEAHFLEGGLARRMSLMHQAKAIDNLIEWNDFEKAMHHLSELLNQCAACLNPNALFLVREIARAIQSKIVPLPTDDDLENQ